MDRFTALVQNIDIPGIQELVGAIGLRREASRWHGGISVQGREEDRGQAGKLKIKK